MVVEEFTVGKVIVKIHDDFVVKTNEQNNEIIDKVNAHISKCLSKLKILTPDNELKNGGIDEK